MMKRKSNPHQEVNSTSSDSIILMADTNESRKKQIMEKVMNIKQAIINTILYRKRYSNKDKFQTRPGIKFYIDYFLTNTNYSRKRNDGRDTKLDCERKYNLRVIT